MSNGFRRPSAALGPRSVEEWAAEADAAQEHGDRPWLDAPPDRTKDFLLRIPAPLHVKLGWLKKNLPGGPSMQQQAIDTIEAYANAKIEEVELMQLRLRQP